VEVTTERERMRQVLATNKGFVRADRWIDYGLAHEFRPTHAEEITHCPDCGGRWWHPLGQFVHYSTLIRLQLCQDCGLAFTDTRLSADVIAGHFERAYKDEQYFATRRRRIFAQLVDIVSECTPRGGHVLDFGGAKGHLLASVREARPDVQLALCDPSAEACRWAAAHYDLTTHHGGVGLLERLGTPYDTVIMSDVLYLEPDLRRLWRLLPNLIKPGGSLIVRGPAPHRLGVIRLSQVLRRSLTPRRRRDLQDRLWCFNPEHLYVFTKRYLKTRLETLGFSSVIAMPAELLVRNERSTVSASYYQLARLVWILSGHSAILTPSSLLLARKR
jgi:2-polyprenyl-3-methyl-5-hydroxy-6-metoxy-1,4-benzoquinol methylase